jgi:hypothetical protein
LTVCLLLYIIVFMQSDKEIQKITHKFDFFKRDLHKERKEKFLFGTNIFLHCINKSASFINWFLVNPLLLISLLLILKTISLSDIHQFIETNKNYFPELGASLFSIIISIELIVHMLKGLLCPQDKRKLFVKRFGLSLATTIFTYKIIELSWTNIVNAI